MRYLRSSILVGALCAFTFQYASSIAFGASGLPPDLRRLIIQADMVPWERKPADLNEVLRDANAQKVTLRQFTGEKPLLVYMYAQW